MNNKLTSSADVRACLAVFGDMGLSPKWSGLCVWINAEPTPAQQVELVQVYGCRWSEKRAKWYLRANDGVTLDD